MQGGNKNGLVRDARYALHPFPDFSGGLIGKGKDRGWVWSVVYLTAKSRNQGMGFAGTGSCLDKNMLGRAGNDSLLTGIEFPMSSAFQ